MEWLGAQYHLVIGAAGSLPANEAFDLCILDGPALKALLTAVEAEGEAAASLVWPPFLLIAPRDEIARFTSEPVWQMVDEWVGVPIEAAELRIRVQGLLQTRWPYAEGPARTFRTLFKYADDILQTVRQPLLVLDSNLRVVSANRFFYKSFRTSAQKTRGRLFSELGNRQWNIPRLKHMLNKILPEGDVIEDFWVEHDFPSIGHRIILLNARRMRSKDGRAPELILLAMEDVTQRRRLEEGLKELNRELQAKLAELENVNEELSQFTYVASHDLKAPLRAIHNYVDFLWEDLEADLGSEQREYMDGLRIAVKQGEALIHDLLAFARIGKTRETIESVDIAAVVQEMKAAFEADGDTEIVLGGEWPVVEIDRALLAQVLWNLTSNAVKFNRSSPKRVRWQWRHSGPDFIELCALDNGIGINPKFHDQIFMIFQRLHTREEFEGTGIGLAIVRKAVKLMGGSIRIESQEGSGSAFFVRLPRKKSGV